MRLTKTTYGELPIVVDPTTGRARLVRGGATTALEAGQAGQVGHVALGKKALPVPNPSPSPSAAVEEFDSKLEAKRARYWSMLVLSGEIIRFKYHPFTIPIGPKRTYTPDFLVEYPDRRIVIEEVKGSLKMKNARDSVTRHAVAAGLLPSFSWRLVIGPDMEERLVA